MSRVPRLLPLLAVVIGGVLAVRAISGLASMPDILATAKAFAEEAAPSKEPKTDPAAKAEAAKSMSPLPPAATPVAAAAPAPAVCAPTAAELAHEAGLSPAELQVLQNLGVRRGQLDQREQDMDVQLQLLAAAEAKIDAKLASLSKMKTDIQSLLGQADAQKQAEVDRLVRVYEAMKPKDAAARVTLLDDGVRLPMAAKMKERALSAILAQMPAAEAKSLTEKLAGRFAAADQARQALAAPAATPAAAQASAQPDAKASAKTPDGKSAEAKAKAPARKVAKAKPRPKAKPEAVAQSGADAAGAAKPAAAGAAAAPAAKAG